jgi:hypothetical protein
LERKARFFAVKPQKMCYRDREKVNAEALKIGIGRLSRDHIEGCKYKF